MKTPLPTRDSAQTWHSRLRRALRHYGMPTFAPNDGFFLEFDDFDAYQSVSARRTKTFARRSAVERRLRPVGEERDLSGYCIACERRSQFLLDYRYASVKDGERSPNWRERLVCECGLNNRLRAAIHVLKKFGHPRRDDPLYITEQVTPLYRWLSTNYTAVQGSEYTGDGRPLGSYGEDGVRNESITRLTFAGASFRGVLSFDVLEHVPNYMQALSECSRVLMDGGFLLFSVPFLANRRSTLIRARLGADGSIEHLEPPEYHGDPWQRDGCLCFYHFGWDILDACREAGFRRAKALSYWSKDYAYLGGDQLIFLATK